MEKMYLAKSNAEVVFVADEKLSLARIAQEAQNYLCQEEDYKYIEFIEINDPNAIPQDWKDRVIYGAKISAIEFIKIQQEKNTQEYQHYLQLKKKFEHIK